jgi:orotate phosphoribosyltransferase
MKVDSARLDIARGLLSIGAVKLSPHEPFIYASGLKGPIYCDNRLILSHVKIRNLVIDSFLDIIKQNQLSYDLIGGIATAGIPHAAFVAERLQRPMVYIRPKPKGHGMKNQVEGDYRPLEKVLLFEDLVNLGSSLVDAMKGITEAKLSCADCFCVVTYQMPEANEKLRSLNIKLWSLTDFDSITKAALELRQIDEEGMLLLKNWHSDPKKWSDSIGSLSNL